MKDKPRKFLLDHAVRDESGIVTAAGRGGDLSVPIGTRFVSIYKIKKRQYPHGLEAPAELESKQAIELEVAEVSIYGKSMNALPGNTTGCLIFSDNHADLPPAGWILSTQ